LGDPEPRLWRWSTGEQGPEDGRRAVHVAGGIARARGGLVLGSPIRGQRFVPGLFTRRRLLGGVFMRGARLSRGPQTARVVEQRRQAEADEAHVALPADADRIGGQVTVYQGLVRI